MTNSENLNTIRLIGKVPAVPEYSHVAHDEKFYTMKVESERLSKATDTLNVMISEKLLSDNIEGSYIEINGQIRTHNVTENEKNHLRVNVFARDIKILTPEEYETVKNVNDVQLEGFICKKPIFRVTPFKREIADILIAVNRAYNKSDYIPAITWGRDAKYVSSLPVGTKVEVSGRLQSREYNKTIDGKTETRVAYELSISRLKKADEVDKDNENNEEN